MRFRVWFCPEKTQNCSGKTSSLALRTRNDRASSIRQGQVGTSQMRHLSKVFVSHLGATGWPSNVSGAGHQKCRSTLWRGCTLQLPAEDASTQDVRDNRGMTTLESVHRASVCRCGCCGVGGGGGEEQVHHVGRRSPPPSLAELASGETENAVPIASLTSGHRIEPLGPSSRSRHARLPMESSS